MIKFIPQKTPISSIPNSAPEFVSNKSNEIMASKMNDYFKGNFCAVHPEFENIIEVDINLSSSGKIGVVHSFCCGEFKSKLELIAQNKNPFTE